MKTESRIPRNNRLEDRLARDTASRNRFAERIVKLSNSARNLKRSKRDVPGEFVPDEDFIKLIDTVEHTVLSSCEYLALVRTFKYYSENTNEAYFALSFELRRAIRELFDKVGIISDLRDRIDSMDKRIAETKVGLEEHVNFWSAIPEEFWQFVDSYAVRLKKFMIEDPTNKFSEEMIDTIVKRDKEAKVSRLYNQVVRYIDNITDTSLLSVAPTGEINGFIKGSKGTVEIRSIPAGGYNIQCFHYRTLVKLVK